MATDVLQQIKKIQNTNHRIKTSRNAYTSAKNLLKSDGFSNR